MIYRIFPVKTQHKKEKNTHLQLAVASKYVNNKKW